MLLKCLRIGMRFFVAKQIFAREIIFYWNKKKGFLSKKNLWNVTVHMHFELTKWRIPETEKSGMCGAIKGAEWAVQRTFHLCVWVWSMKTGIYSTNYKRVFMGDEWKQKEMIFAPAIKKNGSLMQWITARCEMNLKIYRKCVSVSVCEILIESN